MPVDIKWFPPSWVQLKAKSKVIYIDPAYLKWHFVKYPTNIVYSDWPDEIDGMPENLEKGNLLLITHSHKDHCKVVTINRLRDTDTMVLAPKRCTKALGDNFKVVKPGDKVVFEDVLIRAVDAYNTENGSSTRKNHHKGDGVGYLITIEGQTIYHAGDTDFIPEMKKFGHIDVALLPAGGTFTMDVLEAIEAALVIKPTVVMPMHFKDADLQKFKTKIELSSSIKVVSLKTGESYKLE